MKHVPVIFRATNGGRYRIKSITPNVTSDGDRVQTIVAHVTVERLPWWQFWVRR